MQVGAAEAGRLDGDEDVGGGEGREGAFFLGRGLGRGFWVKGSGVAVNLDSPPSDPLRRGALRLLLFVWPLLWCCGYETSVGQDGRWNSNGHQGVYGALYAVKCEECITERRKGWNSFTMNVNKNWPGGGGGAFWADGRSREELKTHSGSIFTMRLKSGESMGKTRAIAPISTKEDRPRTKLLD